MNKKSYTTIFVVVSILLLAIGGALDYLSSSTPLDSEEIKVIENSQITTKDVLVVPINARVLRVISIALYSLGISIFISVAIITRLEKTRLSELEEQSERLRESINHDVFDAVFKKLMPQEIFSAVKETIIEAKMIREDAQWIYDFEIKGDKCNIRQTIIYNLTNPGNSEMKDPIVADLDKHGGEDRLTKAVCEIDGQEVLRYNEGESTHESVTITDHEDEGIQKITMNTLIPGRKTAKFTFVYHITRDKEHIEDLYFSKYPIINGSITANFPEGYDFILWLSASGTPKVILSEKDRKIITISGCFLPQQGYQYRLKRKV